MTKFYVLDGKTPVPCESLEDWARTFEASNRHVAQDIISDARVSTVFLGVNHAWDDGPPLIFETMIFGGPHDGHQTRASTWEEAEQQHAEAVAMLRGGLH